ncbi:MAG: S41 family peptidase [Crocinitomicaceae bacterium]|nr:S41 family peptidase [Crocinitomicaceae bacterium]
MKNLIVLLTIFWIGFTNVRAQENNFEVLKNLEIFELIYKNLDLYYVDAPASGKLIKDGIDAMLESLDPYTVYIPESRIEDFRFMTTGEYGGIGAIIQKMDDGVYISEPYENNPAQKAGLRAGDKLLKIEGKSLEGLSTSDVSTMLKGQKGTSIKVEFERNGEKMSTNITRDEIKIPDVPYTGMLDDEIGYVKLNSFTQTASGEVGKAIKDLRKQGMKKLIFDLRGNGGGLLVESVKIVNFFIDNGIEVVRTKGRIEQQNRVYTTQFETIDKDMPLVVLIDGNSASASEIVSGSLQDLDRAVIVGTQSYGKGLVQQTKDLKYNAKLKLTIAKYYTPSGRCIQKLDYAHRDDYGSVDEVPDSLINKFKTNNGREVIDGRGIEPDVHVDLEEFAGITATLIQNFFIFKYASKYFYEHESIPSAKEFKVTDEMYQDFVQYLSDKEYEYTTQSEKMLADLKKVAENEKYYEEAQAEYEALLKKLQPSKEKDLMKFKEQIIRILGNEIVSRYYYEVGRLEENLFNDRTIKEAISVLKDTERYQKILSGK